MDPTKKELYTAKRSSGLDITDEEIRINVSRLRSDSEPVNWILLKVSGSAVLTTHAVGDVGYNLISALTEDDVYYGAIKVLVAGQIKFYHIYFVGTDVGGMKKGKSSLYKSSVLGLIDAHGEISCASGLVEFTYDFLIDEISKQSKIPKVDIRF